MNGPALSSRKLALAAATAEAAARARAANDTRQGNPPAAGDRFVLRATAELPVEWVLLEEGKGGGFLAVPADAHPLVGSADIELPASSSSGALRLRCGFPVWLDAGQLEPGLRAGTVDRITLEKARRKARGADLQEATEVDGSTDYRDWIRDTIAPAFAVVDAGNRRGNEPEPWSGWRKAAAWSMAASILLLIAGAWAGGALLRQSRQAEAALVGERTAKAQELRAAAEEGNRRIARLREEYERQNAGLRATIAQLEQKAVPAAEPLLNVSVVQLYAENLLRSEAQPLRLSPQSRYFVAVLHLEEEARHPTYRVILTRQGRATPVWQSDGLKISNGAVSLALPGELLPSGSYRFELFGLSGKKAELLAKYGITIAR